jgi:hypothetical protein
MLARSTIGPYTRRTRIALPIDATIEMHDAARLYLRSRLARPAAALAAALPVGLTIRWMRAICWIQLIPEEILAVTKAVRQSPGCRLLVFGVGNDSGYWHALNRGGTTVFLEHDEPWLQSIAAELGPAHIIAVQYDTRLDEWPTVIDQPSRLAMRLPSSVRDAPWDVILVDAPPGRLPGHPGRMQSIYEASRLVSSTGHVFVHDCHRQVERVCTDRFLGPDMALIRDERLRHYRSAAERPLPTRAQEMNSSRGD